MGTFELYQDPIARYRFRLKDGQGTVIAAGDAFMTKEAATEAIEAVRREAASAETVEVEG
jgi:uncharacterized protein YegP (UPF0339 family)